MPHLDYPFVAFRECRKCKTTKRFHFQKAWQDKDGTCWASYKDIEGHEDYWTVTQQVYAALTRSREAQGRLL